ncbi:MAG: LacI family DNA-binding transcriptional regulator [Oscillospiraceae bacterium]|nr:LacI family DNA-binding transcriptional regulator [Oscillospiraceae bacterium]
MTIKDLARACGVSVSTVSRVLNNRPDVSDRVRSRVLAMVESVGYIPNGSARDLVRSRSDAIGVVVRGGGNLFFADVLKTVSREIDAGGYTMVLRQIGSDDDEVIQGAALEREKKLRGIIFLGGRFDYTPSELGPLGVPYVCCSYTNRFGSLKDTDYSSVSIDDFETARQAVDTLIGLGHRRIAALLPGCADHSISELRYKGYLAALADHGIPFDPALLAETGGCFEMPEAYAGMERLLEQGADFTAVFALSDTMAIAAVKALTDHGRRVPEDCSVIAIDGLKMSEYTIPTLTTMVQPAEEMGRESVHLLLELIEGRGEPRQLLLDARLREGGSIRKI